MDRRINIMARDFIVYRYRVEPSPRTLEAIVRPLASSLLLLYSESEGGKSSILAGLLNFFL